jgi:ABC-type antimicrobial peptide transport system permease subunit
VEEDIAQTTRMFQHLKVLMIGLTVISFITAIFGVFAVIYVAVNSRRVEIVMMRAIGISAPR